MLDLSPEREAALLSICGNAGWDDFESRDEFNSLFVRLLLHGLAEGEALSILREAYNAAQDDVEEDGDWHSWIE